MAVIQKTYYVVGHFHYGAPFNFLLSLLFAIIVYNNIPPVRSQSVTFFSALVAAVLGCSKPIAYLNGANLIKDNSMLLKALERVVSRYVLHGEVNEPLQALVSFSILHGFATIARVLSLLFMKSYIVDFITNVTGSPYVLLGVNELWRLNKTRGINNNSGFPDKMHFRGNGGPIVGKASPSWGLQSTKGTRPYSTKVDMPAGLSKLASLRSLDMSHPMFNNTITDLTRDIDLLYLAYNNIKSKPGLFPPFLGPFPMDFIDNSFFVTIQKEISTGSFRFGSRTMRLPGVSQAHHLSRFDLPLFRSNLCSDIISSLADLIVQELLRLILDAIYTKTFNVHSHGFISGKSCHTALKDLKFSFGCIH